MASSEGSAIKSSLLLHSGELQSHKTGLKNVTPPRQQMPAFISPVWDMTVLSQ